MSVRPGTGPSNRPTRQAQPAGLELPEPELRALGEYLAGRVGLNFPPERWRDLDRAIGAAAREFGFSDTRACLHWLLTQRLTTRQVEILASHLTVGETYFFRDPAVFAALEERILPELMVRRREEGSRHLRLWSAGCSSGEEAYSLAAVLDRVLPDPQTWNATVLATDINPRSLAKATHGVYGAWSFRSVSSPMERYCHRTPEGLFEVAGRLKERVTFTYLNLADDVYPAVETNTNAMDVIFCRNVLMYFRPDRAAAVIERLGRCLVDGGWLVVAAVELPLVASPELVAQRAPNLVLFRKTAPENGGWRPEVVRETKTRTRPTRAPAKPRQRQSAEPVATAAAKQSGTDPLPLARVAEIFAQGHYAQAAAAAQTLLLAQPDNAQAMALLARAHANQGELDQALAWCDRAVAAEKLNPAWSYLQASVLLEQGQTDAAAAALRRTLYLDHDSVLAHFALGGLLARQGRRTEASRHFRNALSVLGGFPPDLVLPESGGMTAERLKTIIEAALAGQEDSA